MHQLASEVTLTAATDCRRTTSDASPTTATAVLCCPAPSVLSLILVPAVASHRVSSPMSSAPSHAHVAAASSGLLLQSDPLHRACKAGRWAEVRALISECGRTRQARSFYVNRRDANGSSPIFHCVWYGFYRYKHT